MATRLPEADRDILQFRPDIQFIEPEQEAQAPTPVPERLQLEDIEAGRQKLKQLAKAVDTLAAGVQARADERAKNMEIALDPIVDQDTIQAMRRHFPTEDPTRITYDQYRECKDHLREYGEAVGKQGIITPEDVARRADETGASQMGGFGTPESRDGRLRPELDARSTIIKPIDIQKLQIDLICILINFIWKNFLKPMIVNASPPVSWAFKALPDKVCDPGGGVEIPDLFILGDEPPKILTGEDIPEIPQEAPEF